MICAIAASAGVALALARSHTAAHAAPSLSEIGLLGGTTDPWGVALDGKGNEWVAIPMCDPNPVCSSVLTGSIVQVNRSSFSVVNTFREPAGYSSPLFLAVDGSGNVWFSEPMSNSIGEFIPGSNTWHQWKAPTASAAPFDLAFDSHGNLWFTEILANKIGEFNPSTGQFIGETPTPSASSKPYGITLDSGSGTMWFTENNSAVARIASFTPPSSGALSTSNISEYLTNALAVSTPHLIASDGKGGIWWSDGWGGRIGRLVISQAKAGTSNGVSTFPEPSCGGCTMHASGIGVDSSGTVWFDDSLRAVVFSYNPGSNSFASYTLTAASHPHDGLAVDSGGNVYVSEEFADKLARIAQSGLPVPTPSTTPPGPVSKTWYFAEGRVGKGFREYITLENPSANACSVSLKYLYTLDGSASPSTRTVSVTVPAASRLTEPVHGDLGMDWNSGNAASVATIVNVTGGCNGVVAERPMYFLNYHGISSGTDVIGATHLNTTWYLADVATGAGNTTYLSVLNPGSASATVTASYYANGQKVQSQTITVPGNARGTFAPNNVSMPAHVAAVVTSSQPVMVERPTYFVNLYGVSGAADVVAAPALANDWLFAEGYTNGMQENLTIANVDPANKSASVTITLKSKTGATRAFPLTLGSGSQVVWNVNANDNFPNSSPEVSAEVQSSGANIVVQREMYFVYHHTVGSQTMQSIGGSDVIGLVGPAKTSYSFAEGYTNAGYNEWLTLQNPTGNTETIYVTLVNSKGRTVTQSFSVGANSRFTVDVTAITHQYLVQAGDNFQGYEVAMTVQTLNGAPFVAERPMYWNTSGSSFPTQGGSDVVGYIGG